MTEEISPAKIFTIPAGENFLDLLADGIASMVGGDALALSRVTVLLPTRRACRALRDSFLRRAGGAPLLPPRLRPLGAIDDDEPGLAFGDTAIDLPPAIAPLRRRLVLAQTILKLASKQAPVTASQAIELAAELAALLDEAQTEQIGFAALEKLVPDEYAEHWRRTIDFLAILSDAWPDILAAEGATDPADRRNQVLTALAESWRAAPPADPIIAAGTTGSIPATAALLKTIAHLPNGAVVLPGLDAELTDDEWEALDPSHPQFGLKQLLDRLETPRAVVRAWPHASKKIDVMPREGGASATFSQSHPALDAGSIPPTKTPPLPRAGEGRGEGAPFSREEGWSGGSEREEKTASRRRLLSAALRPAATMADWRDRAALSADALKGVARIDAADQQQEAGVIALLLREALQHDGRTAALITPDRDLARRTASELRRFGVTIDDSAGQPLGAAPPIVFLRLVAELICEGAAPAPLLAAFKHPLAAGGTETVAFRANARALEMALLRGPRPGDSLAELVGALRQGRERGQNPKPDLADWLDRLREQAQAFIALAEGDASPADLLRAHVAAAEAWAATDTQTGAARLWSGDAGAAAAEFIAELAEAACDFPAIDGAAYPAFFAQCLQGRVLRPAWGGHPRLHILGPLEARLLSFDTVILGGLNEGVWPAETDSGPWMSRPMRGDFGLQAPERRIGQAAHDFVQAACAKQLVLTRAARVENAPSVPSRWLERLDAALKAAGLDNELQRRPELLFWREQLDHVERGAPLPPPAPRPPVAARPRKLSVTEIETWRRDPYVIYARRILCLRALDPLDAEPGAAERGQIIHDALAEFIAAHPKDLPPDAEQRLLEFGRTHFGGALARPGIWAFWWPRFQAIAHWFIDHERARRPEAMPLIVEGAGTLHLPIGPGGFILNARADRIDRLADGSLAIIDYKTGGIPDKSDIIDGYAPQLPLEAVIAREGGFAKVAAAPVTQLQYWRLSGGKDPGEVTALETATYKYKPLPSVAQLADEALAGLRILIQAYDNQATPYAARPRFDRALRYNDYEHLARVKEWSAEDLS